MKLMRGFLIICILATGLLAKAQADPGELPVAAMESIYQQVKTPYKYGLVVIPESNDYKVDCPTVFRNKGHWFMSYIRYDGRGYETWLAKSEDLLHWTTLGRVLAFSDSSDWDNNQKAGYNALLDYRWGGSYKPFRYKGRYWMSYLGGHASGYESGMLSVGISFTSHGIDSPRLWTRLPNPVLKPADPDARWWENNTIYKSSVLWDRTRSTGHSFVMYYNAKGDSSQPGGANVERIGMAVSDDMEHWTRYRRDPVLDHHEGITGDAVIQKIAKTWVMFYFGAFWNNKAGAFNNFACSYDLVHWTDWKGKPLISPSEPYDETYAHKSFVVKYDRVVYHFYCAVNRAGQRGIALATSRDLGKSLLTFSK